MPDPRRDLNQIIVPGIRREESGPPEQRALVDGPAAVRICSEEDCRRPVLEGGYCVLHD